MIPWALVVLGVGAVLLTESRSGLAALVLVLSAHGMAMMRTRLAVTGRPRRAGRRTRVVGVGAVVAAVICVFTVPAVARHNPVLRLLAAAGDPGTSRSDHLRLDLLRAATRYLGASDGFGTGAASFEALLARDPHPGVATRTWLHNSFLQLTLQYGWPIAAALGALLAVLVSVLVGALVRARPGDTAARCGHDGAERAVDAAHLASLLIGFLTLGCVAATVVTSPFWWLLLGEAVATAWSLRTAAPSPTVPARPASPQAPTTLFSPEPLAAAGGDRPA